MSTFQSPSAGGAPSPTRERILTHRGSARLLFDLEAVGRLTGPDRGAAEGTAFLEAVSAERSLCGLLARAGREEASQPDRVDCVVADDHPIVSRAVADVLARHGIAVVGSARTGRQAIELIETARPAVALVDLRLPGLDGAEVARTVSRTSPGTGVILYTGVDAALLAAALQSGARGFLLKEAPLGDLPRAVAMVARGHMYVDPALASFLVQSPAAYGLDGRELEILRLVAAGLTAEEIAGRLFFSAEAVRSHLRRAMAKLNAHTRSEAVATAVRRRLIS